MPFQETQDPAAWTPAELGNGADDFLILFDDVEIEEMKAVINEVRERGFSAETVTDDVFQWPRVLAKMQQAYSIIRDGKGVVVLGDLPVDVFSKDELGVIYWGLGTTIGRGVYQSIKGDRLGHVKDMSDIDPTVRAYQNKNELTPHTDHTEVVGLLCLRDAKSGGETPLASALAIHNEMVRTRPDLMERLYRGYRYHRRGEEQEGDDPITPHRVPVFSESEGRVSCRLVRPYIHAAAEELGESLSDADVEALDMVQALARDDRFRLKFRLSPGRLVLFNNYTVLHAREPFVDHEQPDMKRHLLRLWLVPDDLRPVPPEIEIFSTKGGIQKREGPTEQRVFNWGVGGR